MTFGQQVHLACLGMLASLQAAFDRLMHLVRRPEPVHPQGGSSAVQFSVEQCTNQIQDVKIIALCCAVMRRVVSAMHLRKRRARERELKASLRDGWLAILAGNHSKVAEPRWYTVFGWQATASCLQCWPSAKHRFSDAGHEVGGLLGLLPQAACTAVGG